MCLRSLEFTFSAALKIGLSAQGLNPQTTTDTQDPKTKTLYLAIGSVQLNSHASFHSFIKPETR